MARAREPSTGISPSSLPGLSLPKRIRVASPKAWTGPERVARPKDISPMTPVEPMMTTKIR